MSLVPRRQALCLQLQPRLGFQQSPIFQLCIRPAIKSTSMRVSIRINQHAVMLCTACRMMLVAW